jgi:hypothetical protein
VLSREQVVLGDEVRVFDMNGTRHGQPPGGWTGRVTKSGPKLVTIAYGNGKEVVCRRTTGRANDGYGHVSYRTLDEAHEVCRQEKVRTQLRALGLDVTSRCVLSAEQLEAMVAVLSTEQLKAMVDGG